MKKTEAMRKFYDALQLLRRSRSTIKTYTAWVGQYKELAKIAA